MKLFIIVKSTLSAGLKAAQAVHAAVAFTQAFPEKTAQWQPDNNVVVLEHESMPALADMLEALGLSLVRFHEPDLDDALTAICVEPAAKRHVAKLKLVA